MYALRRSERISKPDRKTNKYIREEMNAQDTIVDERTRKQLIWYGHVERNGPTAASSVHCATSCKQSLVLLRMGEIIARNMLG